MLNEIELPTGRITLHCFDFEGSAKEAIDNAEKFDLESEQSGFHDYDSNNDITRGYFSFIEPFEVEALVDGITTNELKKRIVTAEFIVTADMMFAWGKPAAIKLLSSYIGNGFATVNKISFEFADLHNLQSRFDLCKSVKVKNPRENPVKTVNMAGKLDTYEEYNCLDARNHELKSVAGVLNMPIGKMTVKANDKGVIGLSSKKQTILPVDAITWLIRLIHNVE
jgi:hypothetical protein